MITSASTEPVKNDFVLTKQLPNEPKVAKPTLEFKDFVAPKSLASIDTQPEAEGLAESGTP
jgi:hypothetical protein